MNFKDKGNVLQRLDAASHVELELGCGGRKRRAGAIGIDLLDSPSVDIVGDVYDVLSAFPSSSVDSVYSYHFLEHVPEIPKLLSELARLVKPGGYVEFVTPHFSNPYFYSDPTHRNFFGLYTFCYYAESALFRRQVPTYGFKPNFEILSVDLVFKSTRPFVLRHAIKRTLGALLNSCTYMKELYEENLSCFLPCYEVRYGLIRKPPQT
jgi:ubiquinone/menaquinone biosynthesis C-methylase UbiE